MSFAQSIFLVLLLILILMIYSYAPSRNAVMSLYSPAERFDVYRNHDLGAQDVYQATRVPAPSSSGKWNAEEAARLAKYTWHEEDAATGMRVYDYYYENRLREMANDDTYLGTAVFPASEMVRDRFPATIFNGEPITLAQKNY